MHAHVAAPRSLFGLSCALLLLAACAVPAAPAPTATPAPTAAPAAQLTQLSVGLTGNTADAPMFIAQEKGYFREQGLDLNFKIFQSANDAVAPLGAGQLDIGAGAISAGFFNAVARGVDIKLVADKGQHSGSPINGFTSAVILVVPKGEEGK